MVRGHQHHHRRAELGRPPAPPDDDPGREVGGGDDDRDAARDVLETEPGEGLALLVGEQELLGVVREDAEPVRALVDHAVDRPLLTLEVELPRPR